RKGRAKGSGTSSTLNPAQAAAGAEKGRLQGLGGVRSRRGSHPPYRRRAAAPGGLARAGGDARLLAPAGPCHVLGDREGQRAVDRPRGPVAGGGLAGPGGGVGHPPEPTGAVVRGGRG